MKKLHRSTRITVRMNSEELDYIQGKADSARISTSTYLRNAALDHVIRTPLEGESKELYRKLAGMANNLNQLAKNSHTQGMIKMAITIGQTLKEVDLLITKIKG